MYNIPDNLHINTKFAFLVPVNTNLGSDTIKFDHKGVIYITSDDLPATTTYSLFWNHTDMSVFPLFDSTL